MKKKKEVVFWNNTIQRLRECNFKERDTIQIKNPKFPYQETLKYIITKVNKTTVWCYEITNPKHIYKGIQKSIIRKVYPDIIYYTCDLCGRIFFGTLYPVYDENFNKQTGLISCEGCYEEN